MMPGADDSLSIGSTAIVTVTDRISHVSTHPLSIRPARPTDRSAIARLTLAAYREYASVMLPDAWHAADQAIRASLAVDSGVTRLVAELDGRVVGSAALHAPDAAAYGDLASATSWPELRLVAVDPAERGRGIARALVEECIRRARAIGATALGLHTSRSMRAARQLYERMGFVRDPEHDFQLPGSELVEGYLLRLDVSASPSEP
ncbi:MAG: GNAT family N-acetyltransferase [Gemmatimonadetes bacterium]|nr:MAG: GNAT family N-acetyltransferase [Gemmatimonadota bacterium]